MAIRGPEPSLLRMSAWLRVGLALVLVAAIWTSVIWATGSWIA